MIPDVYRVRKSKKETRDTFTLELVPINGNKPISFEPGQFNMVYVTGVGEVPISISSDPEDHNLLTHTTREVGAVTKAMRKLRKGDTLGIRGPFGNGWPIEEAYSKDVIIVAGGIGLAPLRPALYQLISQRERYNKIVVLYGTRSPSDILYIQEIKRWRSQFDLEIYVTVDRSIGGWHGNVGVVTTLISKAPFYPGQSIAYVCGPEVMMRFTVQELQKRGIETNQIYLSMERNMKCGIGLCGHCQFGRYFVCKDGPVFRFDQIADIFGKREI